MRRIVLGVLALVAGCNAAERHRAPGRLFGNDTGREAARDASRDPASDDDWLGTATTGSKKGDLLAGFVVLPDGTPARNVPVEIELGIGQGAPVEVRTDGQGYFRIPGLKPQQSYTLTARAAQNGTQYAGKLYARTGSEKSQRIRIELVEGAGETFRPATPTMSDNGLPSPVMPALPQPAFSPYDTAIPGPVATNPTPAPGAFVETLPPPMTAQTTAPIAPTVTPPPPLTLSPRSDLRTEAEPAYRPPLTTIPPLRGPGERPSPAAATGSRKLSPSGTEFTLVDAAGVPRDFPTGQWVLLDFMTTSCVPCTKSVPLLTALQERYAAERLEVIGLVCDESDPRTRQSRMRAYAKKHAPGYPLLTEPADEVGALLSRFEVTKFPTLVLLDGDGQVVWRGHPADVRELAQYLER